MVEGVCTNVLGGNSRAQQRVPKNKASRSKKSKWWKLSQNDKTLLPLLSVDYDEVRRSLDRVTNTMLDSLECGSGDCTRIVVSSHGAPLMRHPPRFVPPFAFPLGASRYDVRIRRGRGHGKADLVREVLGNLP